MARGLAQVPWGAEAGAWQPWGTRASRPGGCPHPQRRGISRGSRLLGRPLRQPEIDPSFPGPFLSLSGSFSGSSQSSQRYIAGGGRGGRRRVGPVLAGEPRKQILVPTGSRRYAHRDPRSRGQTDSGGRRDTMSPSPTMGSLLPLPRNAPDARGSVRTRRPTQLQESRTAPLFVLTLRFARPSQSLSVHPDLSVRPS